MQNGNNKQKSDLNIYTHEHTDHDILIFIISGCPLLENNKLMS